MPGYLSNHWSDVNLIKLDPSPGSEGPFLITQEATDPNDATQTVRLWILRTDGKWIDAVMQFSLKPEERVRIWFENIRDVMDLLGNLPQHPEIFFRELTNEEKAAALADISQLNLETIKEHVRTWKNAHERS
jgi:hypothetical protein